MITTAILLVTLSLTMDAEEGTSNLPASVTAGPRRATLLPPPPAEKALDPEIKQSSLEEPASDKSPSAVVPNKEPTSGRKISARSEPSRFSRRVKVAGQVKEDSKAGNADEESIAPSSRRSTWWITTGIGLVIVLAVIYGGGRALRAFLPGMSLNEPTGPIQVLYRTFLTPKQVACLIRCGDRLLLVGLSGDRMQTLAEIRDPAEIDFIKGQCMALRPRSTTKAFRDMFRKQEETWSPDEAGAPVTFATASQSGGHPSAARGAPATPPNKPSGAEMGDFARQLEAVRAKLFAGKARAGG